MRRTRRRIRPILSALGVLLGSLAGCSAPAPVDATLSEYSVQLSSTTVTAGEITFKIANRGQLIHELAIVQTDLGFVQMPVSTLAGKDRGAVRPMIAVEPVLPGDMAGLRIELPPGRYLLLCDLPGHFESGMRTAFTVTE